MNNHVVLWAGFSHRYNSDQELIDKLSKTFSIYKIPYYRINSRRKYLKYLKYLKSFFCELFDIKTLFAFVKTSHIELKHNHSLERFAWLILRIGWISRKNIKTKFVMICRGVNDPLITYAKLRYKSNVICIILPHGTDFSPPNHFHWMHADFWCTDYLLSTSTFNKTSSLVKFVQTGRHEYKRITRIAPRRYHNRYTEKTIKVGIIFPHTTSKLCKSQLSSIEDALLSLSPLKFALSIRLHPGDAILTNNFLKYQPSQGLLKNYILMNDLLIFPTGPYSWISNVFYESLIYGVPSIPFITSTVCKNLPIIRGDLILADLITHSLPYAILRILKSNSNITWYDKNFTKSSDFDEKFTSLINKSFYY